MMKIAQNPCAFPLMAEKDGKGCDQIESGSTC